MTKDTTYMTTEESLLRLLSKRGNKKMNIKETLEDIKETVCNSRLYVSPFELDNYMCSLGAVSYFGDNSEKDFKEDGIPCWYFPKFKKWIGIEKEYSDKYTMHLNDVVIID